MKQKVDLKTELLKMRAENVGNLTKREYFAAMAMQGIQDQEYIPLTEVARMAVKQADALIEALNAEAEGE
ncbi:MAG: hypothetical protein IM559_15690 [Pseudanabaena sp. M151S2SP2A07QC]|nr:hypothetical protein [Pseudanabaena sp. M151S2SP2A07QC]